MIDSVLLRRACHQPLPEKILQKFVWRGERYSHRNAANENSPRFFYRPSADGKFYLAVEASLPKILYGHNVCVLKQPEITSALAKLSEIAGEGFGRVFDCSTASVGRVDYCSNFAVGSKQANAYLKAAAEAAPPYLKRKIIGRIETVEFFNDQRKIYLYNKELQTSVLLAKNKATDEAVRAAAGLIRLECRFNNSVAVRRLLVDKMQLPAQTAEVLLNTETAKRVLTEALTQFELHRPVPTAVQRTEKLRLSCRSGNQFQSLVGFLELCHLYGQDNLVRLNIVKKSLYYKNLRALREAGALIETTYHTALPALSLM